MRPAVHVYCGPTISAAEAAAIVPGAVIHPPVRHGDLLRLDPAPGLTVVIIDGAWHQVPAVRHKEILWLLAHGAAVAGAASMGALRAAELHPWGMTGIGEIYRAYRDGILAGDDEVAVAMAPGDCRPLSVAMADVTDALARAAADGALGQAEAAALGRPGPQRSTTPAGPGRPIAAAAGTGPARGHVPVRPVAGGPRRRPGPGQAPRRPAGAAAGGRRDAARARAGHLVRHAGGAAPACRTGWPPAAAPTSPGCT